MHYHEAAIQHKKDVDIDFHLENFFAKLAVKTLERYAHIAHIMEPFHEEEYYKVDLKCQMWDYEADFDLPGDWRWRYYYLLEATNKLLN